MIPIKTPAVLSAALFVCFGIQLPAEPGSGDAPEKAQVQKLVDRFAAAVNAKDAKAFGSIFAPDGEFTNPVGMSFKGRTAIEKFHAALFSENNRPSFAHAHLDVLGSSIRFLRPDVATVNIQWRQTGAISPEGYAKRNTELGCDAGQRRLVDCGMAQC
jgi:uncharacterized protein (TIGR02246 family)